MEIKERKIMTELDFSEEEGDLLIKVYDVIQELTNRNKNNICEPIQVFQDIVEEIQDQKKWGKEKYKVYVEDYYYTT